ncbi:MAG: hypothetical protein OSJ43_13745 [Oscillospiraceae bacterium]|nr:hypothetical protein [Oscillospiraceae bacterium]
MEELIEQYHIAKKWRKEMFFAMIAMLALMVVIFAVGFVISGLLPLFLIFGGVVGALGVLVNILSANTLKKAAKIIGDYLTSQGKTEEEINTILEGSEK